MKKQFAKYKKHDELGIISGGKDKNYIACILEHKGVMHKINVIVYDKKQKGRIEYEAYLYGVQKNDPNISSYTQETYDINVIFDFIANIKNNMLIIEETLTALK